jgi:hypothetical protein
LCSLKCVNGRAIANDGSLCFLRSEFTTSEDEGSITNPI